MYFRSGAERLSSFQIGFAVNVCKHNRVVNRLKQEAFIKAFKHDILADSKRSTSEAIGTRRSSASVKPFFLGSFKP